MLNVERTEQKLNEAVTETGNQSIESYPLRF